MPTPTQASQGSPVNGGSALTALATSGADVSTVASPSHAATPTTSASTHTSTGDVASSGVVAGDAGGAANVTKAVHQAETARPRARVRTFCLSP